jgi:ribosome-associated translation inhibitor RaiA
MHQLKQVIEKQGMRVATFAIALVAAFTLNACAAQPQPPTQALQAADSAITNAEQSRVADYASAELTVAREKLAAARVAIRKDEMEQAEYLAMESRVHAELAYAQAEEVKAKAVNDEMQQSIDTLQDEINRTSGVPQ